MSLTLPHPLERKSTWIHIDRPSQIVHLYMRHEDTRRRIKQQQEVNIRNILSGRRVTIEKTVIKTQENKAGLLTWISFKLKKTDLFMEGLIVVVGSLSY